MSGLPGRASASASARFVENSLFGGRKFFSGEFRSFRLVSSRYFNSACFLTSSSSSCVLRSCAVWASVRSVFSASSEP